MEYKTVSGQTDNFNIEVNDLAKLEWRVVGGISSVYFPEFGVWHTVLMYRPKQ